MIYTATKQMLSTSIISGIFCLVVAASQPVYAQPSQETEEDIFNDHFNNWYQVELIVFERIERTSEDSEIWPKNITLTYPPRLEYLIPAEEPEITGTEEAENAETTDLPVDSNSSLMSKAEAKDNRDLLETLQSTDPQDPLNMKYRSAIEEAEKVRMTPKEQPYIILGETLQDLNDDARRLGRDRSMRVLFHQSWRQPMTKEGDAPSIVMTGGDTFGEHFELEGSIKLYVSRYLHLHTNLWLTQFEANVGQESDHWPPVPERPQPLVIELDLDSAFEGAYTDQQESIFEESLEESLKLNTQISATSTNFGFSYSPDDTPLPENELSYANTSASSLLNDYSRLAQKPFITKHIVTMKQKRRMRSKELHYLDHPKLGILINIKKYEPEFLKESENDG